MDKAADAFRTISEVSEVLDTPAHVLRFWESRFAQVKPVKRAGGRRYYRPEDVALLAGIRRLLHEDGLTIRGVQKLLREQGVRFVIAHSEPGAPPLGSRPAVAAPKAGPVPAGRQIAAAGRQTPPARTMARMPGVLPGAVGGPVPALPDPSRQFVLDLDMQGTGAADPRAGLVAPDPTRAQDAAALIAAARAAAPGSDGSPPAGFAAAASLPGAAGPAGQTSPAAVAEAPGGGRQDGLRPAGAAPAAAAPAAATPAAAMPAAAAAAAPAKAVPLATAATPAAAMPTAAAAAATADPRQLATVAAAPVPLPDRSGPGADTPPATPPPGEANGEAAAAKQDPPVRPRLNFSEHQGAGLGTGEDAPLRDAATPAAVGSPAPGNAPQSGRDPATLAKRLRTLEKSDARALAPGFGAVRDRLAGLRAKTAAPTNLSG